MAAGARVTLLLVGDGIGNPHNARPLMDAAALLGAGCGFRDRGGRLAAALGPITEAVDADLDGLHVGVAMETARWARPSCTAVAWPSPPGRRSWSATSGAGSRPACWPGPTRPLRCPCPAGSEHQRGRGGRRRPPGT